MKSVLMSIRPKWCELIAIGKKTVEVRKTRPKLETPFKVYIYCTKPRHYFKISPCMYASDENLFLSNGKVKMSDGFEFWGDDTEHTRLNCKVIGEFVCEKIDRIAHCGTCNNDIRLRLVDKNLSYKELDWSYLGSCKLSYTDIDEYSNGRDVYGWHISDLVIYDKPKELGEFVAEGDCSCENCHKCGYFDGGNGYNVEADCLLPYSYNFKAVKPIFRAPQSWCYVEEVCCNDH